MPRITISYRRDDTLGITGRIFDRLAVRYGRETVFRDIDNVPVSVDFRAHIGKALNETDVLVAVIGTKWLGPRSGQNRLMNGADPVRIEVETALRKEVPLIPVLVSGATMPSIEQLPDTLQSFAYRNALTIDVGKDFEVHMTRLFAAVSNLLRPPTETEKSPGPLEQPHSGRPAPSDAGILTSTQLAKITGERDALRTERDTLVAEIEQLRERERMFRIELNYTADETAATQRQLDEEAFAASLEATRRSFAKLIVVSGLAFAVLAATVGFVCLYAFLR